MTSKLNSLVFTSVWVDWLVLDTAGTFSGGDHGKSHVAFLSPDGAPGVLHDPVFLTVLRSITNNKSGVIKVSSTARVVENTTFVLLEDSFVSLDGDRDWLLSDCSLHLVSVVGFSELIGGNIDA